MTEPKYFMSTAVKGGMWRVSGINDLVQYWDEEESEWMTSTVETLKDLEEDSTCYRTDSDGNPLEPAPHVGQGLPVEEDDDDFKCPVCGLVQTKNPHPEAGIPDKLLEVGAVYDCMPCAIRRANKWHIANRELRARIATLEQQAKVKDEALDSKDSVLRWIQADGHSSLGTKLMAAIDDELDAIQAALNLSAHTEPKADHG